LRRDAALWRKAPVECTIACSCGKVIPVTEGMAGASLSCECGATVVVPPLTVFRAHAITDAALSSASDSSPHEQTKPEPRLLPEIIAPTWVCVRTEGGAKSDRRAALMAAMSLYRLNHQEEARAAIRKASDWIDERTRKAGDDVRLGMEYEFMRPAIEGLLREARQLLGEDVSVG